MKPQSAKTCVELNCDQPAKARRLCIRHYMKHRHAGTLDQFEKTYRPIDGRYDICENGCWEWAGEKTEFGYGCILVQSNPKRRVMAHRYMYEKHKGPIPDGAFVCHHCDNPPCCNPDHLFLGSAQDNSDDAVAKNRLAKGEQHGISKLTEIEVLEIRESSEPHEALASTYGVVQSTISRIKNRKRWGWLE